MSIKCMDGRLYKPVILHPLLVGTLDKDLKALLKMEKKGLPDDPALLWSMAVVGKEKMYTLRSLHGTRRVWRKRASPATCGCKIPK